MDNSVLDRRRQQKAWQENLRQGLKQRVMLKGQLTPPVVSIDGDETVITPTELEVWICEIDDDYSPSGGSKFRRQRVTDEVVTVAVYDPTLPETSEVENKVDGLYGHIELIDGIVELTWVGC